MNIKKNATKIFQIYKRIYEILSKIAYNGISIIVLEIDKKEKSAYSQK